jgi:hypothetical protein
MTLIIRCKFCKKNVPLIIKSEGKYHIEYTGGGGTDNGYWAKVTYQIKEHNIQLLRLCKGSNNLIQGFHKWDDSMGNNYYLGTKYPK